MKRAFVFKKQASGLDFSFRSKHKYVQISRCKIRDQNDSIIDVDDWPAHVREHLQQLFAADDEEEHKIQKW
eukprot:8846416-Karenia_brevis.AAC.1